MISLQDIKLLDIETTSYCNLHCPQCPRFDQQGYLNKHLNLGHLDFSKISPNLNLESLVNLEKVCLEGDHGDPIMHPEIEKIIDFFKPIKTIELYTNGSIRNKKWWAALARFKNLTVTFSVDGLADTLTEYRIGADFNKIMANAKAFISSGGSAVWKFIVFRHNQHQVEQTRALANELGFIGFKTEISNRNFYDNDEFPVYIDGEYQGRNLKMSNLTQTKSNTVVHMMKNLDSKNFQPITCLWAKRGAIYINYQGSLIPCCMTSSLPWRKDISGYLWQKIVGDLGSINLYNHELSTILNSEFYQHRLRDSLQSIKTVHHTCFGNCS